MQGPLTTDMVLIVLCLILSAVTLLLVVVLLRRQDTTDNDLTMLRTAIQGLQSDKAYFLTARHLGPLHDKFNTLAREVSELRSDTRAMSEQLRIVNRHLLRGNE